MGLPSLCGPTSQYRWRIHILCADDNRVSPANNRLCARGNFTTGELFCGAPAIGLLAISNSLLVESGEGVAAGAALLLRADGGGDGAVGHGRRR
jgi:hypothetical protein